MWRSAVAICHAKRESKDMRQEHTTPVICVRVDGYDMRDGYVCKCGTENIWCGHDDGDHCKECGRVYRMVRKVGEPNHMLHKGSYWCNSGGRNNNGHAVEECVFLTHDGHHYCSDHLEPYIQGLKKDIILMEKKITLYKETIKRSIPFLF